MINLSSRIVKLLSFVFLSWGTIQAADLPWPTKEGVDIYHSFGEFRSNRYHAGLDIRTGGKPGRKVYSPVDGSVYRIKMAYNGYGKGLYVKGSDGRIYVYGHLHDFAAKIDSVVKQLQVDRKRYAFDKYFKPNEIPIKAGELIALTGQTGAGAPHLHFEVRETESRPVNPLLAGFKLNDRIAPTLERIGFQYVDSSSLFINGRRSSYVPVDKKKAGEYRIGSIPYLNRPFGLLVDGFDQSRYNGIKQAVYKYSVKLDGKPCYEITFDTLDFEIGRSVNLNYDYVEAGQGRKRTRRLFRLPGNDHFRAISHNSIDGLIAFDSTTHRVSLHEATVTAEDVYGNSAVVRIPFFWGPKEIFRLDSTVELAWDTTFFYFDAPENIEALQIDSVEVFSNSQDQWGKVGNAKVFIQEDGNYRVEAYGGAATTHVLRLVLYTGHGIIDDQIFSGKLSSLPKRASLEWEIVPGGLAVKVLSKNVRGSWFYLRAFDGERCLGSWLPSNLIHMREYQYFIPASAGLEHITMFDLSPSEDKSDIGQMRQPVNIYLIGKSERETVSPDSLFTIKTDPGSTYGLEFVSIEKVEQAGYVSEMQSGVYEIKPEYLLTKRNFEIEFMVDSTRRWLRNSGVCWFNEADTDWVWLSRNRFDGSQFESESMGGGQFAVIMDRRKPKINKVNIRRDLPLYDRNHQFQFEIEEELSKIDGDTSIVINLDGEWLIPEYDPETGVCITRPNRPMEYGQHELDIVVTDRAGNSSHRMIPFRVEKPGTP